MRTLRWNMSIRTQLQLLLQEYIFHNITVFTIFWSNKYNFGEHKILLSKNSFSRAKYIFLRVRPWLLWSLLQMMDKGEVKTYDSIQKLLNETSHLKQAISPAERLKLFPRRNSSMRTPQSKLSSVTQTLQEEAEDKIQDTRLWASQAGIHADTIKLTMVSKWYRILDDLLWEHLTFIMKKLCIFP